MYEGPTFVLQGAAISVREIHWLAGRGSMGCRWRFVTPMDEGVGAYDKVGYNWHTRRLSQYRPRWGRNGGTLAFFEFNTQTCTYGT